ncbi:NAD(P)/FAD-dependent oxidoreductase [Spirillospora sp. NBC_01491]|uniref:NAD(P)/FAD-dependent oxidoreductase n=1 Tax=Spirillospora sp. NBC_01491 TaxID=2976007 RepID=UPI002E326DA5|nr:FAD-dependent oxidoreductase [Spirillospora sp. NBC_01491]
MSAKVVIVGAGYAGVSAAKRLARDDVEVTVVNPRPDFVERIRLHQLMAGNHPATRPLASLLPRSTALVRDSARTIDADRKKVELGGGGTVDYNYLIYAAGSRSRLDLVPGASEHAVNVGGLQDAITARKRLDGLPRGSSVTIIGGGLTGVELAAELAELRTHRVHLVTGGAIAASVGEGGRRYIRRHLAALGAEVTEDAAVAEVQAAKVVLADGRVLRSDLAVMTAAFETPALARDSGLRVGFGGALAVDRTLVSASSPAIVGAGDASWIGAGPLRMSCQAAIPLGAHAAQTVLHLIDGTEPRPVRPKFTSQCVSLGRRSALWQRTRLSDEPASLIVTGRAGALIKEQICRSTLRLALNPRLTRLSYGWT